MSAGYFKAWRSVEAMELLIGYPNAFTLLYVIAFRAQRTATFNRYGLKPGQALVGDFKKCGLTERQYRTAKQQLETFNFATFKATSKGTIATLTNTRIFDINADDNDGRKDSQATVKRRTSDGRATTTKNVKKQKKGKRRSENRSRRHSPKSF